MRGGALCRPGGVGFGQWSFAGCLPIRPPCSLRRAALNTPLTILCQTHNKIPPQTNKQNAASRLIRFVFSAMRPARWWLAAAYAVLLAGAGCQLYLPLLQGAVFNAIGGGNVGAITQDMATYAGLTAASLASSFFGGLLMERAAAAAMAPLYRRLFDHMLAQSPAALATVSPGELMARTSGDAAVMYSLLTGATYRIVEGVVLTFGSLGFLIQLLNLPYAGPRVFQCLVPVALVVSLLEAAALAAVMRPVNLRLRQAMGRMYGELRARRVWGGCFPHSRNALGAARATPCLPLLPSPR